MLTTHDPGGAMPSRVIAALLATGFTLAGCQTFEGETESLPETADSSVEAPINPPAPPPDPEPEPAEQPTPGEPTIALSPCDDGVKSAIDKTIGDQTQAFRDGDFDAAYALASPSFQAGITVDVFASLIRLNYPQLLTADNARSGSCEADITNGLATILVRFDTSSDPAYTLRYVMELVEGQWRISGANQESVPDIVA